MLATHILTHTFQHTPFDSISLIGISVDRKEFHCSFEKCEGHSFFNTHCFIG